MSTSGSETARLVRKLLVVLAVAAATTAAAEYALRRNLTNEDAVNVRKYGDVFREQPGADIFILGNSQSAYGIVPSRIAIPGHAVHNYSFPGACASFNDDLYRDYLRKYQRKPKLVIYAVSWFMFDSKTPPRRVAQDRAFVPWGVETLRIPPHDRLYLVHQTDVLSRMFKRPSDRTILKAHYDNGFVPLDESYRDAPAETAAKIVNSRREMSAFLGLLEAIRRDGVPLLFVETPEYTPGVTCESMAPNERFLRSVAQADGIGYLNYNGERRTGLNFDRSCFGDWRHLNYRGARIFSKMLSDDIADLVRRGRIVF